MRLARPTSLQLIALGLVVVLAGCSDSTGPANPPPPAGTYALTSFQNPPNPAITPPTATGTLVLTASTYNVTIDVQGQGQVQDQGTYTISGNNWTQTSTSNPGVQSTGTFSYTTATGVLKTDVTAQGFRTITLWQKQ